MTGPAAAADAAAGGDTLEALVERLDLALATDRLVPLSRWVTPPTPDTTRRYDTRFFVADLPEGGEVAHRRAGGGRPRVARAGGGPRALRRRRHRPVAADERTLGQLRAPRDAEEVRRRLSPVRPPRRPRS